jgi:hypothetical protein
VLNTRSLKYMQHLLIYFFKKRGSSDKVTVYKKVYVLQPIRVGSDTAFQN